MSIWGQRVSVTVVAVVVAVLVVGALLAARVRTPARDVPLVVRGMAFYVDGDWSTPNPTITVNAGERVRVVLRNEERGITHDFAVPALGAATDLLNWNEQTAVTFDVPDRAGTYEYTCQPHAAMMRGRIVVR